MTATGLSPAEPVEAGGLVHGEDIGYLDHAPRPEPIHHTARLSFHPTGLAATLAVEVVVVRSATARKCHICGRKRVLFAMSLTDGVVGNPDVIWKCAPDAGLR